MKPSSLSPFVTPVLALALLALPGVPPAAEAQAPDAAPPVEQLVERALSRAPSIQAQRARIAAATASALAADALPEPMVGFEYRAAGFPRYTIGEEPGSMLGVTYTQNLLSNGRRKVRRAAAEAEAGVRQASLNRWASDLAAAIRLQYARLYVVDRERETLGDAAELLRMLEATVTSRYAAGDADQASVLRVQVERSRLGERRADLENERISVQATLNRLTDDPPDQPIGRVDTLPPSPLPADVAARMTAEPAASISPELVLRQAEIVAADRRVASAREELRPAWSLGGGLFWQGGWNRMAVFTVGIELPIWKGRKQQPRIEAAEHDLKAATLSLRDAAAGVRAEALRLVSDWQTADEQVERYREAILPQNSAALDATRSSYLVGRSDFVAVLDQFRSWIDVRIGLAKREADRFAARTKLGALLAPEALPASADPAGVWLRPMDGDAR